MIPDLLSYILAGVLLAYSIKNREAVLVTALVAFSLLFDRLMFQSPMDHAEVARWAGYLALKDITLATVIFYRYKIKEFPIVLGLLACCLLHQWIRVEAKNQNLTLFYLRPDIMSVVVSTWLASLSYILITGGGNGGKRDRRRSAFLNYRLYSIFHPAAHEVKS